MYIHYIIRIVHVYRHQIPAEIMGEPILAYHFFSYNESIKAQTGNFPTCF